MIFNQNKIKTMCDFEENLEFEYGCSKNFFDVSDDNLNQQNFFYPYKNDCDQFKDEFNDKEKVVLTEENIKQIFSTNPGTRWENSEPINEADEEHIFYTKNINNNSSIKTVNEIKNGENDSSNKNEIKDNIAIEWKIDLSPPDKKKKIKLKMVITPQNDENKIINNHPFISVENKGSNTKVEIFTYKKIVAILKKINISDEIIKKIKEDIITIEFKKSLRIFKTKNKRIRRKKRRNRKFKRINKNKVKKKKPMKRGRIS